MCEHNIFKMMKKKGSTQTGLYCADCGKWLKWLGKQEINRYLLSGIELIDFN